ncbi:Protein phosphatase 2C (PP2C)-like domain [Macleaya cordata]|uniref:protein-serine/threonine phosphatase n=1 Tax=Macleaya cordata TaxID=56857 RepID=A0A200PWM1_MACCD|nr:Protein phosphatase 2C (PP2C)-like domain [Macleaya cordata]
MGHFSYLLNGLTRSFTIKRGRNCTNEIGKEVSEAMAKEAKKNDLILHSSGVVNADGSKNFASVFSKRGEKGVNQDCFIVWEEYGCQEDMMFCGVFDGHGPWGHFVARQVRESMPSSLLCNWQEALALTSLDPNLKDLGSDKKIHHFDLWKQSFLKTCATIDKELEQHRKIDCFNSGTTALSIVRQGEFLFIANVGDSRAVLATVSDDGSLAPVQLTIDFKPSLPQETERIRQCRGRVFCLHDEPGVHRVWLPDVEAPGLAMSRAFGDYCVKNYGVISVPEVTQRNITSKDQFVVLATDGVWDVISNQEAVQIVSSTLDRGKAAKRLVECAVKAWKRKRKGIATDDISAICLFFHSSPPSQKINPT